MSKRGECDVDLAYIIYIDDHHDLIFRSGDQPDLWLEAVGNWSMLGSVVLCCRGGFEVQRRKLVWASRSPSKTLGVVVDLSGPVAAMYPETAQLETLIGRTMGLVSRRGERVMARELLHVVGHWVFLSVFEVIFCAITGKAATDGVLLSDVLVEELILLCVWLLAPLGRNSRREPSTRV